MKSQDHHRYLDAREDDKSKGMLRKEIYGAFCVSN